MGWVPGGWFKKISMGELLSWGRLWGWQGVGDGASRFLGYARNDMVKRGMTRGMVKGRSTTARQPQGLPLHIGDLAITGRCATFPMRLPLHIGDLALSASWWSPSSGLPLHIGDFAGDGADSGWGWGRRDSWTISPHHVIPSVAEESRRPPLTPFKTSRFLGYARNDMGVVGNGMGGVEIPRLRLGMTWVYGEVLLY